MPRAERLDVGKLRARLRASVIGREIFTVEETSSTNDLAFQFATDGAAAGTVVFAEKQTAGRGQHGRVWESSAGRGLWFSIILRPQISLAESPRLTTWLAQTIARAIQKEIGLAAIVKPPNDVMVVGKKVAGVLVEMRAVSSEPHVAIAGVGINVNQRREDFSSELQNFATSLALENNSTIDREDFAAAILRALDESYPTIVG